MRGLTIAALAILPALAGCMQSVPKNRLTRKDLPEGAQSGIIVFSHGHQGMGYRATWKEGGSAYVLSEGSRLGPREDTPFGKHPTDALLTVLQVPLEEYERIWFIAYDYDLWKLWTDPGILDSEVTYSTFVYHHVLLWKQDRKPDPIHIASLSQSANSPIFRDSFVKMWDQGIEHLDRFFRGGGVGRPYYLIRDGGKFTEIAIEPASEGVLAAELKHARADRRAAAATLLGELGALNDMRAGLEALLDVLDAGEKDDAVRRYMIWAVGRMYPRFTELVDKRQPTLSDPAAAEQLRAHLTKQYPESVLRVGSATEKK